MTDYGDHLQPSRGPSLVHVQPAIDGSRRSSTRTLYYNHNAPSINATTRSWVHSQQNTPVPPPLPLPIPLPTPVHRLRPLPDPHAQHRSAALYTVNPSEPLDREEEQERVDNIRFADRKSGPNKLRKPPIHSSVYDIKDKKRTVMGGFVKSIRRIPKIVFRYGSGKETTDGEGTSTSTTGITTGNTLPQYASNPPTPVVAPVPSHPHLYTYQQMGTQIPRTAPVSGPSPPPEVVRLDDVRRHRPDFRIMPPSINVAHSETAHFFPGTTTTDNPTDPSSSAANAAERTTAMLYNHAHHTPSLTPPLSRQISSNGLQRRLSNVGSERIVRPISFHGGSQALPPIEIPPSISRKATTTSYLSYVSQPTSLPPTLPLNVKRSSSQLRSLSNQSHPRGQHQPTSPPENQQASVAPFIESSEPIQSPITAHPQPTTDYLKMAFSPPHPLQNATSLTSPTPHSSSGVTSFSYDPSFSKPPRLIERIFKTLYHMPWIAYERITVDYLPGKVGRVHGHGLSRERRGRLARHERKIRRGGDRDGRRRKDRNIRVSRGDGDGRNLTWYKGHSKSTSAELDLLTSDLGSHSSPSTTNGLGATIGLGLENLPADAATAALKDGNSADPKRRQREPKENLGDKQGRPSRSRRHHHRQDRHRGSQGRRVGSIPTPEEENGDESFNRSPSPLIPAVYPFYYPPYPYTYPYAFTMCPLPGPHAQSQSESQQDPLSLPSEALNDQTQSSNQREQGSSSSRANHGQPQPVVYNPGVSHSGYTAAAHGYQPMVAPLTMTAPQVYLLHSASHAQLQTQPLSASSPPQNGTGVAVGGGSDSVRQ